MIAELAREGVFDDPIVTEVTPLAEFHPAEGYHQGYYRANPNQAYCRATITPKVTKLRQKYAARLKSRRRAADRAVPAIHGITTSRRVRRSPAAESASR